MKDRVNNVVVCIVVVVGHHFQVATWPAMARVPDPVHCCTRSDLSVASTHCRLAYCPCETAITLTKTKLKTSARLVLDALPFMTSTLTKRLAYLPLFLLHASSTHDSIDYIEYVYPIGSSGCWATSLSFSVPRLLTDDSYSHDSLKFRVWIRADPRCKIEHTPITERYLRYE